MNITSRAMSLVAKYLPIAFDGVRAPSAESLSHLKNDIEILKADQLGTNKHEVWRDAYNEILTNFKNNDLARFLRWACISRTMVWQHQIFARRELNHLRALSDFETRWKSCVREEAFGSPIPLFARASTSANLVHTAYHVAMWEETTGKHISELESVFEFGGGYGCMARVLRRLGFNGLHVIFDLPPFSALQRFYLRNVEMPVLEELGPRGIYPISDVATAIASMRGRKKESAMFLSTWAFSEVPMAVRAEFDEFANSFSNFLIAFQHYMPGLDNDAAFSSWHRARQSNFGASVNFKQVEIPYLRSAYLFGFPT